MCYKSSELQLDGRAITQAWTMLSMAYNILVMLKISELAANIV
jgi:hypothetical protein